MQTPQFPPEQDMRPLELARRRQHLLAEIARDELPLARHPRHLWRIGTAAAIVLIVAITGTLLPFAKSPHAETPAMLLASTNHAVSRTVDVVLYAKETHYETINPTTSRVASEGWVDKAEPGVGRVVELNSSGQPLVDSASSLQDGHTVRKDVAYQTDTVHVSTGSSVSLTPLLPDQATNISGTQTINGVKTIHLFGVRNNAPLETWINQRTQLPTRVASYTASGLVVLDYQWLQRTPEALSNLIVQVPGNFTETAAPISVQNQANAPGSTVVPIAVPQQILANATSTLPAPSPAAVPPSTPTAPGTPTVSTSTSTVAAVPATTKQRSDSTVPRQSTTTETTVTTPPPNPTTTTTATTVTTATTSPPPTTTPPPTTAPAGTPYATDTQTNGTVGQHCVTTTIAAGIQTIGCVGVDREDSNTQDTGIGDARVFRAAGANKYQDHDYLVTVTSIEIKASNGEVSNEACYPSCHETNDYSVSRAGPVYSMPPSTPRALVTMSYQVFASSNQTTPIGMYTVTMPNAA